MLGNGLRIPDIAVRKKGAAGFVFPQLQPLVPSAVMDLDATSAASYSGSGQTWSNLVAAPADGSAQTAYDFFLGADVAAGADDPVFSGSAGSQSAEFTANGSQFFTIKNGNTTFIKNMHKTTGGNAWWMAFAGSFVARGAAQNGQSLVGTGGRDSATKHGFDFGNGFFGTSNRPYLQLVGAQGFPGVLDFTTAADAFTSGYIFIGISFNPTTNAARLYVGNNAVVTGSVGFYLSTVDASNAMQLLAGGAADALAYAGTKLVAVSMGNAEMSDANAAALRGMYSTRHNRTY